MSKFQKGESGNPAGRPKGAGGKTAEQLRTLIQNFIEENWDSLQDDFDQMKPAERANFRERLLRYLVPEALNFDKLSVDQLEQVLEYLKNKKDEEK